MANGIMTQGQQTELHPKGTPVRFSASFLARLAEKERKRHEGREGVIRGYRMQSDPIKKPIVFFPKSGRYGELLYYEMDWADIDIGVAQSG